MLLRELRENETELLQTFLYEAIFILEGVEPPDRSIIEQPELSLYYENFGSGRADHCIISENYLNEMTKPHLKLGERFGYMNYGYLWYKPYDDRQV